MDMNFDVKGKIEELVDKIQKDPALLKSFQSDPIKTVEKLLGVDLPEEAMEKIVAGVKAKLTAGQLAGAADALKKLF